MLTAFVYVKEFLLRDWQRVPGTLALTVRLTDPSEIWNDHVLVTGKTTTKAVLFNVIGP